MEAYTAHHCEVKRVELSKKKVLFVDIVPARLLLRQDINKIFTCASFNRMSFSARNGKKNRYQLIYAAT